MFGLFKKNIIKKLEVDIHSHLIPSIDDGARNMSESLSLVQGMVDLGYKKLITTPHIMADTYINTPTIIREGLRELQREMKKENIEIDIECAAEYYLDDGFNNILDSKDILTIKDKYILFETSYYSKPLQLEDTIFRIRSIGLTPILAHPERYRYITDIEKEYARLKELGVLFQSNINSFGGFYGKNAKEKALFLSKNGYINFLGSDVHHKKQVESIEKVYQSKEYRDIFKYNDVLNSQLL
ncbi:MAG: capsular biosynthesis protein [Sulfurovum sp.]